MPERLSPTQPFFELQVGKFSMSAEIAQPQRQIIPDVQGTFKLKPDLAIPEHILEQRVLLGNGTETSLDILDYIEHAGMMNAKVEGIVKSLKIPDDTFMGFMLGQLVYNMAELTEVDAIGFEGWAYQSEDRPAYLNVHIAGRMNDDINKGNPWMVDAGNAFGKFRPDPSRQLVTSLSFRNSHGVDRAIDTWIEEYEKPESLDNPPDVLTLITMNETLEWDKDSLELAIDMGNRIVQAINPSLDPESGRKYVSNIVQFLGQLQQIPEIPAVAFLGSYDEHVRPLLLARVFLPFDDHDLYQSGAHASMNAAHRHLGDINNLEFPHRMGFAPTENTESVEEKIKVLFEPDELDLTGSSHEHLRLITLPHFGRAEDQPIIWEPELPDHPQILKTN